MTKLFYILSMLLLPVLFFAQSKNNKPNILLIVADDLGWNDLTCYGSSFYVTPNLDKLAKGGILFTNAYASSPVCSPTRSSILTGKYPIKIDVTDWIPGRQDNGKATAYEKLISQPFASALSLQETTIAEQAVKANYKTFFAGKWHLGEAENTWPEAQGFQINIGGFSSGSPKGFKNDTTGGFFTPYNNPRLTDGPKGEYITDRLTDETISFLDQVKDSSFFIMYSMYAVHNPMQAPKQLVEKYKRKQAQLNKTDADRFVKNEAWMQNGKNWKLRVMQDNPVYAAMVENMDTNIGRLLQKLESLNVLDNTLIIFTSDNGGLSTSEGSPTTNGTLRAGKGWLYEGGVRVPFIMKWPSSIKPNQVSQMPVNTVDIYPTLLAAMTNKIAHAKKYDGTNIVSLLKNKKSANARAFYWHYPHYSNQGGKPSAAIVENGFKLILNYEDQGVEFYDLEKDISEQKNRVEEYKVLASRYQQKLKKWLTENNAKYPKINPAFNTNSEKF